MSESTTLSGNHPPAHDLSLPRRGYHALHAALPTLSVNFLSSLRNASRGLSDCPWRGQYAAPASILDWLQRHPEWAPASSGPRVLAPATPACPDVPPAPIRTACDRSGAPRANYA